MFIVNVTSSPTLIFPLTSAVLLIVKLTGTTSTLALSLTNVLFSLLVKLTTLVQLPTAVDLTTIHKVIADLLAIESIVQLTTLPVVTLPDETLTISNPAGTKSLITTVVAFTRAVLFTTIVKLTKVLFPTTVTLAVLLIVTLTGTTSTLALDLTIVLFSLQVTLTTFVQLPTALDLAVIHNMTCVLFAKLAIFQFTDSIPLDLV